MRGEHGIKGFAQVGSGCSLIRGGTSRRLLVRGRWTATPRTVAATTLSFPEQPGVLAEHLGPFLAVMVKDHHADAGILERLALLLIEPLLQGLVVVRAIDEHHGGGLPVGEVGGHEMAAHFLAGVIGQVMAKAEGGVEPAPPGKALPRLLCSPSCGSARGSMQGNSYIHGTSAREQQRLIEQAQRLESLLAANLELHPGERLLEIGCGVGAVLAGIARAHPAARLSGIDLSAEQIAGAHRHLAAQGLHGIELVVGDAAALPWPEGHMDRVRLVWVVEHLSRPQTVLAEALRVLRPGGTIHLTETDYGSLRVSPPDAAIEALLTAFVAHFNRHGNAHAGPSLGPLLEQVGFHAVAVEMVGLHLWCPSGRDALRDFCGYLLQFITPELAALEAAAPTTADAALIRSGHSRFAALADRNDGALSISVYQARGTKAPDGATHR